MMQPAPLAGTATISGFSDKYIFFMMQPAPLAGTATCTHFDKKKPNPLDATRTPRGDSN